MHLNHIKGCFIYKLRNNAVKKKKDILHELMVASLMLASFWLQLYASKWLLGVFIRPAYSNYVWSEVEIYRNGCITNDNKGHSWNWMIGDTDSSDKRVHYDLELMY